MGTKNVQNVVECYQLRTFQRVRIVAMVFSAIAKSARRSTTRSIGLQRVV